MVKKVLAAVDGSVVSARVAQFAVHLAGSMGARLAFLHVVEPLRSDVMKQLGLLGQGELNQRLLGLGQSVLDQICAQVGVEVEQRLQMGSPPEMIVAEAENYDADIIVLGSHGDRGGQRVMLGSVGNRVVCMATRSVAIVR